MIIEEAAILRIIQRKPIALLFAVASVVVGLSLFFSRPHNFAPIGALGLFAGAYARSRHAWLFPLGALAIHTIAVGGYHWVVLGSVYLGFSMSGFIGQRWIRHRVRPLLLGTDEDDVVTGGGLK